MSAFDRTVRSLDEIVERLEPAAFTHEEDVDYIVEPDEGEGLPDHFKPAFKIYAPGGVFERIKIGYIHRDSGSRYNKFVALGMWEGQPIAYDIDFGDAMCAVVQSYIDHKIALN